MNLSRFVLFNFVTFSFAGFLSSQAWGEDAGGGQPKNASPAVTKITTLQKTSKELAAQCNVDPYFVKTGEINTNVETFLTNGAFNQAQAAEKSFADAESLKETIAERTSSTQAAFEKTADSNNVQTTADLNKADGNLATSHYKSCAENARAAKENIVKFANTINQIEMRFLNCAQNGALPSCDSAVDTALPTNKYQNKLNSIQDAYTKSSPTFTQVKNASTEIGGILNDLITKCEKDAGASELTTGQAALLGVAAGAIAGGVIIKTREDRQKKKNREGNGIPGVASGPNSGNSGNNNNGGNSGNGAGDPPVGSTDGCPAGQARNLNNVCVPTTPNNSTGVGGTPEPGQPQTSTGSVPINPPPPANGGIPNSGGGTPAIGRGLTVRPQTDTTGTTSALSSASNSATPTTNTDAAQNGPVTQQTNESKFWIKIKGENEFVTMKRCFSLTKDKNKCEVAKRNHSRNLTNKIKQKNKNLLE